MDDIRRTVTVIPAKPQMDQRTVMRQLRVAAYCRVSTEEEEQQSSYEAQCTYYTDKIMTNPEWTMAGIFADEGISGTSTKNRDDFNRMIRRCRQKKIDLILTKSISRFARNTLDSLKYIRALKGMGIGIIFEKENINTLETDTELIITFMSAFAQSESESISANVRWGKRQAMKEGKASVNFKKLYGYYLDDEGNPQVNSDQAEAIRSIYDQYLQGASLRMIKLSLEGKAVPNPAGGAKWDISQIRSILGNEKYCGDVLMQKTFTQDCINKKVIKNTGQLPMYLIQNNHPAIVSREIYQAVQAEKTRRSASASPSKKMSSTGRSCYASKFALSERLVCGECGTLYRRCTWKRNGKTRIVWRCVSRLDYGAKYCHQSPTMDEEPLQWAIMTAINSVMDSKETICRQITEAAVEETGILPDSTMTLGEINRRLEELEAEFNILLQQPDSAVKNAARFGSIANEMASLKEQREKVAARLRKDQTVQLHVHTMKAALDGMSHHMQQWDEEMVRQLVHTVKVISADHIKVFLYDGTEIDQTVGHGNSIID
jgi:site-specific DNA recombinase